MLVGVRSDPATQALARAVFARWLPNRTVAWLDPADPASLEAARALAEGKPAHDTPVAYVCRGRTCSLPVRTPAELTPLLVDNTTAFRMAYEEGNHGRRKHINVKHHYIRESCAPEEGFLKIFWIPTAEQQADLFTKALPADRFAYLRDLVLGLAVVAK